MKLLLHPTVPSESTEAFRAAGHDVLVPRLAAPDLARHAALATNQQRLLIAPATRFAELPTLPASTRDNGGLLFLEDAASTPRALQRTVLPLMAAEHGRRFENTITLISDSARQRATYYEYRNGIEIARIVVPDACEETLLYSQTQSGPASAAPRPTDLSATGIQQAGLSNVITPYEVRRRDTPSPVLALVLHGSLYVSTDTAEQTVHAGHAVLLPAKSPFHYHPVSEDKIHTRLLWFHLSPAQFPELASLPRALDGRAPAPDMLHAYMSQYSREADGAFADSAIALTPLASLLGQMIRRHLAALGATPQATTDEHRRVHQAIKKLHENASRPWTVDELADQAGCSIAHLHRLTQRLFKKSPGTLIRDAHMQHASDLLARTDYKLEQISTLVGYADAFTFARAFKRHTGESPGQHRTRLHDGQNA
ncbi:AraC family transcriptional regulator [Geminisphaera colitermitum]|uniref:AraC family transcriptional regulator n=1 Tax=Geminisphaera colitermitum TaxID=1148786 RepID=UPI000158CB95|nr:AraC family transcriptional regulator [Geminisphaera colitermitum]